MEGYELVVSIGEAGGGKRVADVALLFGRHFVRDGGRSGRIITGAGNMPSLRSIHATCRHSVYDHFRSSIFIYLVRTVHHISIQDIYENREKQNRLQTRLVLALCP